LDKPLSGHRAGDLVFRALRRCRLCCLSGRSRIRRFDWNPISDVARDLIGSVRDSFGDLHKMELDVEVTGGSGRVLPFLQSIDNGSGDMVVRTD